ncbi:hypothetical protein VNI00_014567 [Paramarasmius palmivorus]|uniref:Uncharacterized protein n=1 Tax=Paramarasmius palmivorus TaxID=297713 RepID=A0AAW0BQI1_9AGAR
MSPECECEYYLNRSTCNSTHPDPQYDQSQPLDNQPQRGIYTTLFSICTYILLKKRGTSYKYYLLANTLIFLLTCVFVALQIVVDTSQYLFSLRAGDHLQREPITFLDPRRLNRHWSYRSGDRVAFDTNRFAKSVEILSLVFPHPNLAFKILSIGHQVARNVGSKLRNMYRIIIASTLESGILYSTYLVVVTIIQGDTYHRYKSMSDKQFEVMNAAVQFLYNVWPCIAGITTTIIIVRVTLGIALDDAESEVMSILVAETARGLAVSEPRREENLSQGDAVMVIARDEETGR